MKAGKAIRRRVRATRRAWARRYWKVLAAIMAFYVSVVVSALWLMSHLDGDTIGYFSGLATGGFLWLAKELITLHAANAAAGAEAEGWTGDFLKKLGRSGWKSCHNVMFMDGTGEFDVDHVAVGPRGVLAIETKYIGDSEWSPANEPWGFQTKLTRARRSARKVRLLLHSYGVTVKVTPILVLWGAGSAMVTEPRWEDDVLVLPRPVKRELVDLIEDSLSTKTRDDVYAALTEYTTRNEKARREELKRERKIRRRRGLSGQLA